MRRAEKIGRLLLTRNWGESVRIGPSLVTCEKGKGDRVRLVISAPLSVPVFRTEVLDRQVRGEFQAKFTYEDYWTSYHDVTFDEAAIAHSKSLYEPFTEVELQVRDVTAPEEVTSCRVHFSAVYGVEKIDA